MYQDQDFFRWRKKTVVCDRDMIKTAFEEIIQNAIKFGKPENGGLLKLRVVFSEKSEYVIIKIINKGQGIKKEEKELIFDSDYYVKNNMSSFGLGLLNAKNIIEDKHKGYLSENGEPGKTACFQIKALLQSVWVKRARFIALANNRLVLSGVNILHL